MKVYAHKYKTYDGARKRMLLEAACTKGERWIWGVKLMGFHYHIVRWGRAEYQRGQAIATALLALGIDD